MNIKSEPKDRIQDRNPNRVQSQSLEPLCPNPNVFLLSIAEVSFMFVLHVTMTEKWDEKSWNETVKKNFPMMVECHFFVEKPIKGCRYGYSQITHLTFFGQLYWKSVIMGCFRGYSHIPCKSRPARYWWGCGCGCCPADAVASCVRRHSPPLPHESMTSHRHLATHGNARWAPQNTSPWRGEFNTQTRGEVEGGGVRCAHSSKETKTNDQK